jgi:hypothetical protein
MGAQSPVLPVASEVTYHSQGPALHPRHRAPYYRSSTPRNEDNIEDYLVREAVTSQLFDVLKTYLVRVARHLLRQRHHGDLSGREPRVR